jgi:hypothetical protein
MRLLKWGFLGLVVAGLITAVVLLALGDRSKQAELATLRATSAHEQQKDERELTTLRTKIATDQTRLRNLQELYFSAQGQANDKTTEIQH